MLKKTGENSAGDSKKSWYICRKLIQVVDCIVNFAVLVGFLLLFSYGCYGMWDSSQIYQEASSAKYEAYKPTENDSLSFSEMQNINPEVFGWITVYGTNIEYPLVQAPDNDKYMNTNALGEYALSGSLFMDYRNQKNFTDFNSIIYGHHMEKGAMFGDIGNFLEQEYFDNHQYGNLYFSGKNHGLELFAILEINAYDTEVYRPPVSDADEKKNYIETVYKKAKYKRDIEVGMNDQIVLLSTCASDSTDGRHILAGKILNETITDPFQKETVGNKTSHPSVDRQSLENQMRPVLILAGVLVLVAVITILKVKKNRKKNQPEEDELEKDEKNKKA